MIRLYRDTVTIKLPGGRAITWRREPGYPVAMFWWNCLVSARRLPLILWRFHRSGVPWHALGTTFWSMFDAKYRVDVKRGSGLASVIREDQSDGTATYRKRLYPMTATGASNTPVGETAEIDSDESHKT